AHISWNSRVLDVRNQDEGVEVEVECDGQKKWIHAQWLVACDGGRSTVRESLGLALKGTQYEGRYVIVDIEHDSQRPVELLASFDPPSTPESTALMERRPDTVWRIDYQVKADDAPEEAIKPAHVLPLVQTHLDMIGETAPGEPLWISIYKAKCLTLDS